MINKFSGNYKFLSNFYPAQVSYEGIIYPTVEHAYVAAKTCDFSFKKQISNLTSTQAGKAKRMGRKIKLRPDWEKVKDEIMLNLLRRKFDKPILRGNLLATGYQDLIEGNYWHDNYWGSCFCDKCIRSPGHNKLGKLLMQVREEIKNEDSDYR